METYRKNLKQIGLVLIVLGLLDICWMIYCISHNISYASSFNFFAVIAGIFLYRGNAKTAAIAAWFSAFFISGFSGLILLTLLTTPLDLLKVEVKLGASSFVTGYLFSISVICLLVWIYKRLTYPDVVAAFQARPDAAKSRYRNPRKGFLFGSILVVGLEVILYFSFHGTTSDKLIAKAKEQVGFNYKFQVTSFNESSSGGKTSYRGNVTAYNDNEIKNVSVQWEE